MSSSVAAIVYAWFAHGIAFVILPRGIPLWLRLRGIGFWVAVAPLLFLFGNPLTILFLAAAVLVVLAPLDRTQRVAFFLVAVTALPFHLTDELPFPGLNYLTLATHYKFSVVVVLLPILLLASASGVRNQRSHTSIADISLILYALYTAIIVGLAINSTSGLRTFVDQLLILVIPYIVIRLVCVDTKDVEVLLYAFFAAAVVLACVALVSSAKRWDMYYFLEWSTRVSIPDTRSGFLRINATAGTHALGFHLAAGIIILQFIRQRIRINWLILNALRAMLFIGILSTDSRGALGGLIVAASVYFVLSIDRIALRVVAVVLGLWGAIGAMLWLLFGDFGAPTADTFSYRQEVLRVSLEYIAKYPLFGDYLFYSSGFFNVLLQGEGIIDVTNLYLQLGLHYGLLGLSLFLFAICIPAFRAMMTILVRPAKSVRQAPYYEQRRRNARPSTSADNLDDTRRSAAAVASSVVCGWLFLVATTSDVALTMHLGIVFAALCRGLNEMGLSTASSSAAVRPKTAEIAVGI